MLLVFITRLDWSSAQHPSKTWTPCFLYDQHVTNKMKKKEKRERRGKREVYGNLMRRSTSWFPRKTSPSWSGVRMKVGSSARLLPWNIVFYFPQRRFNSAARGSSWSRNKRGSEICRAEGSLFPTAAFPKRRNFWRPTTQTFRWVMLGVFCNPWRSERIYTCRYKFGHGRLNSQSLGID